MSDTLWDTTGNCNFKNGAGLGPTANNWKDTLQFGCYPIGAIVPLLKSFTGVPALTQGWMECDGSTVSDSESPLDGVAVPSLNSGTQRFLRGSTTSGSTGGAETHSHTSSGTGVMNTDGSGQTTDAANHLPPYYEVVYVIRYK